MTDQHVDDTPESTASTAATDADAAGAAETDGQTAVQYGVGPVTIRELAIVVGWLAAFVVSFFPLGSGTHLGDLEFITASVWTNGLAWILTIGVPTVAVFLIVLRRFSPQGIRRVGSLGVDQFASVAMSVAAVVWLQMLWETIAIVIAGGPWVRGWVVWVELALMIALVVLTVFAPLIPPLNEDFQHRPETPAHRNARPVRRVVPTPRAPRPARPAPAAAPEAAPAQAAYTPEAYAAPAYAAEAYGTGTSAAAETVTETSGTEEIVTDEFTAMTDAEGDVVVTENVTVEEVQTAQADVESAAPVAQSASEPEPVRVVQQAFWALAPDEREVLDERGLPIFRVGPTAWALVIEDRGEVFVVRHDDGRIGYLHDVSDITRG